METTQGLYISTVKEVHMNHTALLWQRSELRRPARRKLGDESADTAEWSDVGDPVESALELTINADYPRCSARGVLQRVRSPAPTFREACLLLTWQLRDLAALEHCRAGTAGGRRGSAPLFYSGRVLFAPPESRCDRRTHCVSVRLPQATPCGSTVPPPEGNER